MEQLEQFKRLISFQKDLEYQLKTCDEYTTSLEKDYKQVVSEIENHFEMCMNLLASRKATLLGEAIGKLSEQKKNLEATKREVQTSVDSCALLMKTGIAVYQTSQSAAEHVWEGARHFSCPKAVPVNISVSFSNSLCKSIDNYGEVLNSPIQQSITQEIASGGSSRSHAKIESVGQYGFLMLGNPKVGKTSILQRFVNDNFSPNYVCSTVPHHEGSFAFINGKTVTLNIIDAPGSVLHKTYAFHGLKWGVDGVIYVYDITDYNSLSSISAWMGDLKAGTFGSPKNLSRKQDRFIPLPSG